MMRRKPAWFDVLVIGIMALTIASQTEARGAQFELASNEDVRVIMRTPKTVGYFIGDLIRIELLIEHEVPGVRIARERLFKTGDKLLSYEIRKTEFTRHDASSSIFLDLQSFTKPATNHVLVSGPITVYYTADKYWSSVDEKFAFRPISFHLAPLFQSELDPEKRARLSWAPGYEDPLLAYPMPLFLVGLGLLLLAFQSRIRKKLAAMRKGPELRFLDYVIKGDLSYSDPEKICKAIHSISRKSARQSRKAEEFLIAVLYRQYHPSWDEVKETAKAVKNHAI